MWKAPRDIQSNEIDSAEEASLNAILSNLLKPKLLEWTLNKKLWKPRPQE